MTPAAPEQIDILLVDDRPENLLTLEAVLGSPDYNLITKTSGDEALRYLLDHEPALILMDVQMPELDGFETASIIKRSERTREIPIIFITALNDDSHYVYKGYRHGAVDYLQKPYDANILKSKVGIFADLARKTRRLLKAERENSENDRKERERRIALLELRALRREQADQKRYRALVDGINHGVVWSADSESLEISFISPSAKTILGWSSENTDLLTRVHPADLPQVLEVIRTVCTKKKELSVEHRYLRPDGRQIWLHSGIRLAPKVDGIGYELCGLSVDVSGLKEAEERLRLNKSHSDFLAKASLLLSETLDYETALSRVGPLVVPEFADWYVIHLRYDAGKVRSFSLSRSSDGELLSKNGESAGFQDAPLGIGNVMRSGKAELYPQISEEHLKLASTNDAELAALRGYGIKSAVIVPLITRGRTLGTMTLISLEKSGRRYGETDLAVAENLALRAALAIDNAHLYTQAKLAVRARDEFLSIASHELKTPITPLKMQMQSLLRTIAKGTLADADPERVKKMLQISDRQLSRLSKLIDDLLDMSRINIGKLSLSLEDLSLGDLVREVVGHFREPLGAIQCELEFASGEDARVRWDGFRIEQVLVNLLTNAVKYGDGKPVYVSVAVANGHARISFKDHGIGIAEADQKRIFGRFERGVSPNYVTGLGLGLYIVSQIIEAHGGTIAVESKEGAGSTFTVELPLHVPGEVRPLTVVQSQNLTTPKPSNNDTPSLEILNR